MKGWSTKLLGGRPVTHFVALAAIAFGLALMIMGGSLAWSSWSARAELASASDAAEAEARRLSEQINSVRAALSSDDVGASIAQAPSLDRSRLLSLLREQDVTNVLNIVVSHEAIEDVDLASFPGGGFAATEMLLDARTQGSVPAQVHFAGSPDEYLAIAERLEPGNPESAVVLVTFPVSVIAQRMNLPDGVDGVRLVQRIEDQTASLFSRGQISGPADGEFSLPGTLFSLQWYRAMQIGPLTLMQLVGITGVGLLLLVLGVLMRRRSEFAALRQPNAAAVTGAPSEREAPQAESEPVHPGPLEPDTETKTRLDEAASSLPEYSGEVSDRVSASPVDSDSSGDRSISDNSDDNTPLPFSIDFDENEESASDERDAEGLSPDKQPPEEQAPDKQEADEQAAEPPLTLNPEQEEQPEKTSDSAVADRDTTNASPELADETAQTRAGLVLPDASIFKAYDIRGIVGRTLSPEVAQAIGRAIGAEARDSGLAKIAVARDGRLSGAELLGELTRGLLESGLDVIDVGAVPTPLLYFAARELADGSGVMVTGSHNPPNYNGFKIVLGGETLAGERIQNLYQRIAKNRLIDGQGTVEQHDITAPYLERIASDIKLRRPLKVVVDCGNGIAGMIAPRVLSAIGAEVIPLYTEVDGTFPNHHPDPSDPETLEDLKLCVRNFSGDLGVAFDGDGDRLGVVSPNGEIIYADRLLMLFARDVLARTEGGDVIFDVKCSSLLAQEITDAGGTPIMARTGHSFLKAELQRREAPLAGEMSGHFVFGERWFGFDDGIYSAARLLEILAKDERAPAQVLASLPKAHSTPELKVEMKEGEPPPFIQAFKLEAEFEGAEISTLDGVRADFADGFGLVRASNTTPILVLRFEGQTKEALARIQEQFREKLLKVNPALKLPF